MIVLLIAAQMAATTTPAAASPYVPPPRTTVFTGTSSRGRPDPDINAEPVARARSQLYACARGRGTRDAKDFRCSPGQNGY